MKTSTGHEAFAEARVGFQTCGVVWTTGHWTAYFELSHSELDTVCSRVVEKYESATP